MPRAVPGAREVPLPGAAHLAFTDQPRICAAAIADAAGRAGAPADA